MADIISDSSDKLQDIILGELEDGTVISIRFGDERGEENGEK